jgi:hypothetical protein
MSKGHATPVADIETGLYNKDHFCTSPNQAEVDSIYQTFNSKNK